MNRILIPCLAVLLAPAVVGQVQGRYNLSSIKGVKSYMLNDKRPIRGEVQSVQGGQVRMRVEESGAEPNELTLQLSDFSPYSAYRVQEVVAPPNDAEAQLALARFAVSNDLTESARRSLARARQLAGDPGYGADVEAELDKGSVAVLEKRFQDELGKGKVGDAERTLAILRTQYEGQVTPQQLSSMAAALDKGVSDRKAVVAAKETAEASALQAKEREAKLAPLRKRLDAAKADHQAALKSGSNISQALSRFQRCTNSCKVVLNTVAKQERASGNDAVTTRELNLIKEDAQSTMINCLLSSASLNLTRGQINASTGKVNEVLAMDPNNRQAMAMRGRIETAANHSGWY